MTASENLTCPVCLGTTFEDHQVLWQGLIDEWRLSSAEAAYVDRQQGTNCASCGCNLRSIALAKAMMASLNLAAPLRDTISGVTASILEINEAGHLTPILKDLPGHTLANYPDVDMQAMPYPDASFDLVIHSDTLEHIPHPIRALEECRRILKPGGACLYTVPVIVGRMTINRAGLPPSYHGDPNNGGEDFKVHTEFGADFWTYPVQAGFRHVSIHPVDFPSATAIAAYA